MSRPKIFKHSPTCDAELGFLPYFSSPPVKDLRRLKQGSSKILRKNSSSIKKESSEDLSNYSSLLCLTQKIPNIFQIRNPILQSKKPSLYRQKALKTDDLEVKIQELENFSQSLEFNPQLFQAYQEIFQKTIEKSGKSKKVLEKIKTTYEKWINFLLISRNECENNKILMKEINEKLENKINENSDLIKKIKNLSVENSVFGKEKETARKEFDEVLKICGFDSNGDLGNSSEEWKIKVIIGFKQLLGQSFEKIKRELILSQNIEKMAYKIFNIFLKKGYPIDKVLNSIENCDIVERWKYFNQHKLLRPYEKLAGFIMNKSCGEMELITFGNDRNLDLGNSEKNIVIV